MARKFNVKKGEIKILKFFCFRNTATKLVSCFAIKHIYEKFLYMQKTLQILKLLQSSYIDADFAYVFLTAHGLFILDSSALDKQIVVQNIVLKSILF